MVYSSDDESGKSGTSFWDERSRSRSPVRRSRLDEALESFRKKTRFNEITYVIPTKEDFMAIPRNLKEEMIESKKYRLSATKPALDKAMGNKVERPTRSSSKSDDDIFPLEIIKKMNADDRKESQ